jgi:hypothetical protein
MGATGRDAARCSCNRASYPGDGVTVGGAAWTCEMQIVARTTTAEVVQNRFIPRSPSAVHDGTAANNIGSDRSHFKASALSGIPFGTEIRRVAAEGPGSGTPPLFVRSVSAAPSLRAERSNPGPHTTPWIASARSLSSGAHSRDPVAPRNDEKNPTQAQLILP